MKHIILISLLALSVTCVKAQNNLQFSQVIRLVNGQSYTVPTGKVLKIESVNFANASILMSSSGVQGPGLINNCQSGYRCYYSANYLCIDNSCFYFRDTNGDYYCNSGSCVSTATIPLTTLPSMSFPIWVEAGKSVTIQTGSGVLVSGLEFNVTQ